MLSVWPSQLKSFSLILAFSVKKEEAFMCFDFGLLSQIVDIF